MRGDHLQVSCNLPSSIYRLMWTPSPSPSSPSPMTYAANRHSILFQTCRNRNWCWTTNSAMDTLLDQWELAKHQWPTRLNFSDASSPHQLFPHLLYASNDISVLSSLRAYGLIAFYCSASSEVRRSDMVWWENYSTFNWNCIKRHLLLFGSNLIIKWGANVQDEWNPNKSLLGRANRND